MVDEIDNSKYPLSSKVLSKSTVKKLMGSYVNDETQITPEAVESMQKVLIEHTRWIVNEAEKLATYEGRKRIKDTHIRDAVRTYFGIRLKNKGGK